MRKLVLLLAAALALTACTAAPEVSSPAEAAPPAETAAIGEAATAFPVGTLQMAIPEVMDTGTASVEITFTGLETEPILKLDYAVGVQTKLCDIDLSRQIPVAIMQHGDTVEYFWDSEGSTVFAHTAIRPDGSVEEQTIPEKFYPNFYDEYAAYDIWGTACKRLDWQTGELTTASLPFVQLDGVPGAVGSRVLLTRIVSDARYEVPYEEAGSDATGNRNFPIALTDDGRILVTDGYIDRGGVAASRYALIDLDAYLAGSREYTAVEMWTE